MTEAIYEAMFNGTMFERGWNGTKGINAEKFKLFASLKMSQMLSQEGQKVACKWSFGHNNLPRVSILGWKGWKRIDYNMGHPERPVRTPPPV